MLKDSSNDNARPLASGSSSSRSASRRKRTSFSKEHVELLRATFLTDPYPGISLRESLSQTTGLPESRIQVWFQNRRARTLKCKGIKKALWQSNSPHHNTFPSPPGVASNGLTIPLRPQGTPPAYPAPVKQKMEVGTYYGLCPPAYSPSEIHGQYSSIFGLQQQMGRTSSPHMWGMWPLPGTQSSPVAPLWCNTSEVMSSSSNRATMLYPVQQMHSNAPSPSPSSSQFPTPNTPDSGQWNVSADNSPQIGGQLETSWNGMPLEESYEPGHPKAVQHAPLPLLSLQDILGELNKDW